MVIKIKRYVTVAKRKPCIASETDKASADNKPKRKYDELHLAVVFTVIRR